LKQRSLSRLPLALWEILEEIIDLAAQETEILLKWELHGWRSLSLVMRLGCLYLLLGIKKLQRPGMTGARLG
jgi:hypothetical protein